MKERLTQMFLLHEKNRYDAFDGIRGLAVFMVFLIHFVSQEKDTFPGSDHVFFILRYIGTVNGVDIFFVLSGFLIYTMNYTKPITPQHFIRNRYKRLFLVNIFVLCCIAMDCNLYFPLFVRAFPLLLILYLLNKTVPATLQNKIYDGLHYFMLVFLLIMVVRQGHYPINAALNVVLNVFSLNGYFSGATPLNVLQWALGVEYGFYYLFACLLLMAPIQVWTYPKLFVLAALALCLPPGDLNIHGFLMPLAVRWAGFVFGMLLAKWINDFKPSSKYFGYLGMVALVVGLLLNIGFETYWPTHQKAYYFAYDLIGVALILACTIPNSLCQKLMSTVVLRFLGRISYSVYLIHLLMLNIGVHYVNYLIHHQYLHLDPNNPHFILHRTIAMYFHFALSFGATLFFASLMFYFLERPYFLRKQPTPTWTEPVPMHMSKVLQR